MSHAFMLSICNDQPNEIFCLKIYTGLGWLELQHRIMAAYFGASVVKAKSVLLSLAWIGLLKTFVFF